LRGLATAIQSAARADADGQYGRPVRPAGIDAGDPQSQTFGSPERLRRRLTDLGVAQAQRHGWNDTYTFTKCLGEQVALRGMHGRGLTIVRPAIIESTLREPAPGWIEGVKVADAVILAYARGKTSFFPARREGIIDIVLAGAEALHAGPGQRIYQCCSGSTNPLPIGELIRLLQGESKRNWKKYDRLFHAEPRHDFRTVGEGTFRVVMGAFGPGAAAWNGLRRLAGAPGATRALEKLRTTRLLALTFAFYAHPRYRFHDAQPLALAARCGQGRGGGGHGRRGPGDALTGRMAEATGAEYGPAAL
jgi:hypothetical protein